MPHFHLQTNVPQKKIPDDLPAKLCRLVSNTLGKPLNYVCVTVIGGVNICWGPTDEPAAQATLMSIGALGPKENEKISKALTECITQAIGVNSDRIFIRFDDTPSSDVGYKGTTCQELFG